MNYALVAPITTLGATDMTLPERISYAGTLTLKNCLVTNLADIAYVYRGVMTLGNGARWVTPSRRIHLSQQTKWECTNTVATLNLEEGSDMTIHCLNCGQNGDYKYTNVVDGVEVVSPNVMTSIVNQAGGTFSDTALKELGVVRDLLRAVLNYTHSATSGFVPIQGSWNTRSYAIGVCSIASGAAAIPFTLLGYWLLNLK